MILSHVYHKSQKRGGVPVSQLVSSLDHIKRIGVLHGVCWEWLKVWEVLEFSILVEDIKQQWSMRGDLGHGCPRWRLQYRLSPKCTHSQKRDQIHDNSLKFQCQYETVMECWVTQGMFVESSCRESYQAFQTQGSNNIRFI